MLKQLIKAHFRPKRMRCVHFSTTPSSSNEPFSYDVLRRRLAPYTAKVSYVDELSESLPKLKQLPKASILLPIYFNSEMNKVEVLLMKRSSKARSHGGMIMFPGGMSDPTDYDTVHTAEREAEEEIGLHPKFYSTLGCLSPVTDSEGVMITPVVALLHSPRFVDFRLSIDEAEDAFYLDLRPFLYAKNNHKMFEVGDRFVSHHFHIGQHHIWGVTAFGLIVLATIIFRQLPEFPFFRYGQQLDLNLLTRQLQTHFQMCVGYWNKTEIKKEFDALSKL